MIKTPFEDPDISVVESLTAKLFEANRTLERTNRELVESEALRAGMLANISHDLRAPMTAIRGALDRMLGAGTMDPAEQRAMLELMDRRVSALEHLIGELYYSVSIEQPGFELDLTELPLAPFLEEWLITRQYGSGCEARELRFEDECAYPLPVCVDTNRFVRVLDNLFENALRFSGPQSPIILGCRESSGFAEIYLRDFGSGIPGDELEHIFERTYTSSRSRTPGGESGSGLGLSIVKAIVDKHGGNVRCESVPGSGSTFFIALPMAL